LIEITNHEYTEAGYYDLDKYDRLDVDHYLKKIKNVLDERILTISLNKPDYLSNKVKEWI